MASNHEVLNQIAEELAAGKAATPVTIRTFLSWFGAQRRTSLNVWYINKELELAGLRTVPDYLNIWVDTPITFELISAHQLSDQPTAGSEKVSTSPDNLESAVVEKTSPTDPSYRIGRIASANNPPTSVKPTALLREAITIMMARNFSQLPVMTTDRDVKGMISWGSIGTRSAANLKGEIVQDYMDEHQEILASASLFAGIKIIVDHGYVLVRAPDRKVAGIVTSTDLALQFEEISTPFLLLAEIENHLRTIISKSLVEEDIKKACPPEHLPATFSKVSDLTFGNCVKILENTENWAKTGITLDRVTFCSELATINAIRNDVMHFDPDPLSIQDLLALKNVAQMFDKLRIIGAF